MAKQQLSRVFIGAFIVMYLIGPVTQLIQIVDLDLHVRLGLSEAIVLDPAFAWFKVDELAIAWADMTTLVAGIAFVAGALTRRSWSIWFGFYTLAVWSYWPTLVMLRWTLHPLAGYDILPEAQAVLYFGYMILFAIFSLFGLFYLYRRRNVFG